MCKRHQSSIRQTDSVRHRAWSLTTQRIIRSYKEIQLSRTQNDVKFNITTKKKTVTLGSGSIQKEFLMAQKISIFHLST